MAEELIVLHSPGSLPGIPGDHGPGVYLVDYEARTIRPQPVNEPGPIEVHIATVEVPPAPDIVEPPATNGG